MKVLLQRVAHASVTVDGEIVGRIGPGLLLFVAVEHGDGPAEADAAAEKMARVRVFPDASGRMNLDVGQAGGEALVVSQFTLAGSLRRGRRPSFEAAAEPDVAARLVERFTATLTSLGIPTATGRFGADMKVELLNDGPVTFLHEVVPTAG